MTAASMAIGLSTYAFHWRASKSIEKPLTLPEMLEDTHASGCSVLQICDYPPLAAMAPAELSAVKRTADGLGVRIELGTRGVGGSRLRKFLDLADRFDAKLIRSMVDASDHGTAEVEAIELLSDIAPELRARGVTLALETYEQVSSTRLVRIVEAVGSPHVGICLDPANSVAGLELPRDVVARTAPYVRNWHVKDFAFSRQAGWIGFHLSGCPLGEGLLDYDFVAAALTPTASDVSRIVEHWLPWQGDAVTTCALERQWTQHSIDYLRRKS